MPRNNTNDDDELWTVKELGTFLRIRMTYDLSSVYRTVKRHRIPSRKVGGRLRFVPSEVKAWVQSRKG